MLRPPIEGRGKDHPPACVEDADRGDVVPAAVELDLVAQLRQHLDGTRRVEVVQGAIGAMLDMTLETASRLISRLKREGVIEPVGARATRINMAALRLAVRLEDVV